MPNSTQILPKAVERSGIFGPALSVGNGYTQFRCPNAECPTGRFNVYGDHAFCHNCGTRYSFQALKKLLGQKGIKISKADLRTEQGSHAVSFDYPAEPSGGYLAKYEYTYPHGAPCMVRYKLNNPDGGYSYPVITAYNDPISGRTLWRWSGVPTEDIPLYKPEGTSTNFKVAVICRTEDDANYLHSVERADYLTDCAFMAVYNGVAGVAATDWSQVSGCDVVLFPGLQPEDSTFVAACLPHIRETRSGSIANSNLKITAVTAQSLPTEALSELSADALTASGVVRASGSTAMSLIVAAEKDALLPDLRTEDIAANTNPDADVEAKKSKKITAAAMYGAIRRGCSLVLYTTVQNGQAYVLVRKGEWKNRTVAPCSLEGDRFIQYCFTTFLENPIPHPYVKAGMLNAMRGDKVDVSYEDHTRYSYLGNAHCAADGRLYSRVSDTELAVFSQEGHVVISNSDSQVLLPPGDSYGQVLPLAAPTMSYREYMDALFVSVPQYLRPLIAGYLVVAPLSGQYEKPLLSFVGPPRSGKTAAATLFRRVLTPLVPGDRGAYMDKSSPRALAASAGSDAVILLDNDGKLGKEMSNFIASLYSLGVYAQRQLHTTNERSVVRMNGVLLFTSIHGVSAACDLSDRTLTLLFGEWQPEGSQYCPEHPNTPLYQVIEDRLLPGFRAATLTRTAQLLSGNAPEVQNKEVFDCRSAYFMGKLVQAAMLCGYSEEEVVAAYRGSTVATLNELREADPVQAAIFQVVRQLHISGNTEGRVTDLYMSVCAHMRAMDEDGIPKSARALRPYLREAKPLLRSGGIRLSLLDGITTYKIKAN